MTKVFGARLLVFLVVGMGCAPRNSSAIEVVSSVGATERTYVDDKRMNWDRTAQRPLTTTIWYPTAASPDPRERKSQPVNPLFAPLPPMIEGAALSNSRQKYPLILISHGTGGSALGMAWIGYYLASHGYIVAALNHHGNTGAEAKMDPRGFLLYWERPKDISAVLDRFLEDPMFGPRIDRERIGAAGFSLGGYTVIALAGARFDHEEYDRFCSSAERDFTCGPQPEFPDAPRLFQDLKTGDAVVQESLAHSGDSYRDPRIRAVFAIAPVFGRAFTHADLKDVHIPIEIVVGLGDTVAPPATNARRFAALIAGAKLVLLPKTVDHYTFVPECTDQGRRILTRLCHDAPGLNRRAMQTQVSKLAALFFLHEFARQD
jgi:predicted dienelactone hydrolase